MSARVSSSHTYTFSIYGIPTGEQVIEEVQKGLNALGPGASIRIRTSSDQRDGDSLSATMTSATPQLSRGGLDPRGPNA